jgi:hypothetical protein
LRAKVRRKDVHVRTTARLLAVAALAALALAGCGSSGPLSKADYEQRLQKSGRELTAALAQLSRSNTKEEFTQGVDRVENVLNDVADDLDGITPPEDVQSANARLVDGFRKLAGDFEQVKAAAEKGPDAARQKGRQVTTGLASREADQAIKEIQRRGYDVGELGRS